MTNANVIEGLTILQKYYEERPGYNIGADHDVIYAYATDKPVEPDDLLSLERLGWHQSDVPRDENDVRPYDPNESWWAYV